ncbi:glycosyltransferase [Streptomyces sp. NPDC006872]|uniref:glycosyltransferase n=1 Tax=Streptomyces sp. NPDC006872 TaxID=3155720 RepID=UPI0033E0628A
MTHVLLIAGTAPTLSMLKAAVDQFRAAGATVQLAGYFEREAVDGVLDAADVCSLPEAATERSVVFGKRVAKLPPARRTWAGTERNRWVLRHARRAQVLVALDAHAVYTVWRLAERNRRADAVFGVAPGLRALQARGERPMHYALRDAVRTVPSPAVTLRSTKRGVRHSAGAVLRRASSPAVMRTAIGAKAWRTAVMAPRVPDAMRAKLARRVSLSMTKGGRKTGATLVLNQAADRIGNRKLSAALLADAARADLARAHDNPKLRNKAIEAALTLADQRYKKKDLGAAADQLSTAFGLAFNRSLHFDGVSSPMADDPDSYLAAFRKSAAFQALSAPRGRALPAAPAPTDRPLRLLVTTYANAAFLKAIRDRYENHPDVEIRFLDVNEDDTLRPLVRGIKRIMEHALGGQPAFQAKLEEALRPHLDWADTVFVDWCTNAAGIFTAVDPGTTRMVIRLHSYEAFAFWPHVVDFTRVDDLILVSDHLREVVEKVLPQLAGPDTATTHVVANAMDLVPFERAKTGPDARFNLGLVGVSAVAKDPRWAVQVLRLLREKDERYRLVIIGEGLPRKAGAAVRAYDDLLQADLAELEAAGAVHLVGQTDDVPAALTEVGVILSSSVRESFHCGLVEGTVSGALPVVRDWPFFASLKNGPRTLFPTDWVVSTPEEAAERILKLTVTEENWHAATEPAAKHALTMWDWSVVSREFDRLLLGEKA